MQRQLSELKISVPFSVPVEFPACATWECTGAGDLGQHLLQGISQLDSPSSILKSCCSSQIRKAAKGCEVPCFMGGGVCVKPLKFEGNYPSSISDVDIYTLLVLDIECILRTFDISRVDKDLNNQNLFILVRTPTLHQIAALASPSSPVSA